MKAFHSQQEIKDKYFNQVHAHLLADEIVHWNKKVQLENGDEIVAQTLYGRGDIYWEDGKGSAVGCTIHSIDHKEYEIQLGIPRVLAYVEDALFEYLPDDLALEFPEQFLKEITPGADLSLVWPKFALWLLTDDKWGIVKLSECKDRINKISYLYQSWTQSIKVELKLWEDAACEITAYGLIGDVASYLVDVAKYYDSGESPDRECALVWDKPTHGAGYAKHAIYTTVNLYMSVYGKEAGKKHLIAQTEKLLELLKEAK